MPLGARWAPGSTDPCPAPRSCLLGGHGPAELIEEDTVLLLPAIAQKEVNPAEFQVHFNSSMLPSLSNEENHLPDEYETREDTQVILHGRFEQAHLQT